MTTSQSSYPPGTQFWETADYGGYVQRNLNISLVVISTTFFGIRLYVRFFMTKSPGWDDAVASLAYVSHSMIARVLLPSGTHQSYRRLALHSLL
jgi:hypothetical protein